MRKNKKQNSNVRNDSNSSNSPRKASKSSSKQGKFHLEFKNAQQKIAWACFQQHDVLFLNGAPGTGKSFLAVAFAINELLQGNKKKIILTRPIVEAGEHLGFLPGDFNEKVHPYMLPLYDCIEKLVGTDNPQRELVNQSLEIAPLAYLRGRTFSDAVCILDEAQNSTNMQMKMFLTRLGENSKMIITGDPKQSDLPIRPPALVSVIDKLKNVPGIGIVEFGNECIVRHPLVSAMLKNLESERNDN